MDRYSPRPPPRSFSRLSVECADNLIRPVPQHSPLTKQVNQLAYEIPKNKYAQNPWNYAPEFLKDFGVDVYHGKGNKEVFGDVRVHVGGRAVFDCVLLGSPRPKVCWLFNDDRILFKDVHIDDTADVCRMTIPYVMPHHFGTYTVLCENEVGRAVASAELLPL